MLYRQEELQILLLHTAMVYLLNDNAADIHRERTLPTESNIYTPISRHVFDIPECDLCEAIIENSQLHLGFLLGNSTDSIIHDDCYIRYCRYLS